MWYYKIDHMHMDNAEYAMKTERRILLETP